MTTVASPPTGTARPVPSATVEGTGEAAVGAQARPGRDRPATPARRAAQPLTAARVAQLIGVWLLVMVVSSALVLYLIEPVFQQRAQAARLRAYQAQISHAHFSIAGLAGDQPSAAAPDLGSTVGILEVPQMHLRQAVIEGVASSQTADGPGHVPGTAALGQPGNSAVVGRRSTYGGPFATLGSLQRGDRILVTTVQGQTVYRVTSVTAETITTSTPAASSLGSPGAAVGGTANAQINRSSQIVAGAKAAASVNVNQLYGPTRADQLTLVTSAHAWPLNASHGVVVVATMVTRPFVATPQNGRTSDQTGLTGQASAWTGLVLALQGLALSVVGAAYLNRRFGVRVAYLLTTPLLIAFVILIAEAGSRLLPAWS